jgi:hypothetical protein
MGIAADVVIEIAELFKALVADSRSQLEYYHVSVYKSDTAKNIEHKIVKMKSLAKLFQDTLMEEAFMDYEAMKDKAIAYPGECAFTQRTSRLLESIEERSKALIAAAHERKIDVKLSPKDLKRRQREILALCTEGSRQWAFFQRL